MPQNLAAIGPEVVGRLLVGFGAGVAQKGKSYERAGRVRLLEVDAGPEAAALRAEVKGSRAKPYTQTLTLRRTPQGITLAAACSCPMQSNCKHIAAVLLAWAQHEKPSPPLQQAPAPPPEVSPLLAEWLRGLGDALRRSEEQAGDLRRRLHYVLGRTPQGGAGIHVLACDLDREGRRKGEFVPYDPQLAASATPPKFLRASDLAILPRLQRLGVYGLGGAGRYLLAGAEGAALLEAIVATGRAHWGAPDGPLLRPAEARTGEACWLLGEDGAQRFGLRAPGGEPLTVLALAPPQYLDPATGELGPLKSAFAAPVLAKLLAAPPIAPEEVEAAGAALAQVLPPQLAPPPRALPALQEVREPPRPLARLTLQERPAPPLSAAHWRRAELLELGPVPVLELRFAYGEVQFAPDSPTPAKTRFDGARLRKFWRDRKAEQRLSQRLSLLGFEAFPKAYAPPKRDIANAAMLWRGPEAAPGDYVRFLLDDKPQLEAEGWTIEIDPDFPLRLAMPESEELSLALEAGPEEASGIDWFELSLGVPVDGERLNLLPTFTQLLLSLPAGREAEALARISTDSNRLLLTLPDGRILPLELAKIAPILQALLAVWGPQDLQEGARLHRAQAGDFAELQARLGEGVPVLGGRALAALAGELAHWRERAPSAPPAWFKAQLRPYQQLGLDWLQMLSRAGFGGVLADDMGLGKTVQMLAHLSIEKAAGRLEAPALVVAPTSVLANWRSEAQRFAPELKALVHQGADRAKERLAVEHLDLLITSYPLLARDQQLLLDRDWSVVVLDEAQTIRNPQSGMALAAFALKARQRVALSGTPVENHLGDVWSLMRFLNPGLLGDGKSFRAQFRTPIEKHGDAAAAARLARRLKPFLLRRTKGEVAADLPPKTELRELVTLAPAQRQLYEATRLVMQQKVREALDRRGLAKSAIVVLDALLKLRQACCDPRLVKGAAAKVKTGGSAKLERLLELVEALRAEGRTALVFSQFTSMLELIREAFEARGWGHEWLTGDTVDRAGPVARFQAGEADLFLISLKAGGTGLNLTRADTVILYDPWWNPAVEAQAIDRAHRIGRTAPVFVHRLIAEATIEEKMLELQARKQGFADALWEGEAGGGLSGLSAEDVAALFS